MEDGVLQRSFSRIGVLFKKILDKLQFSTVFILMGWSESDI